MNTYTLQTSCFTLVDHADVETTLMQLDDGVEKALIRAKAWSKYLKDVINYVDKRAALG